MAKAPTILVVDDDPQDRKALVQQLAVLGYATTEANSGRQALRLLTTSVPDAVLLDLVMPDIGGLQVLQHIKGDRATETLPVLVMTGVADKETRLAALASGAEELMGKPIDRLELGARLRNVLKFRAMLDQLTTKAAGEAKRKAGVALGDQERADAATWQALQRTLQRSLERPQQPMAGTRPGQPWPQVLRCEPDGRLESPSQAATYVYDLASDLISRERLAAAFKACAFGQPQRTEVGLRGLGTCQLLLEPVVLPAGGGERVVAVLAWWTLLR